MRLFVAEKPDVARELAAFIGKRNKASPKKEARYIEVGDTIVTWARGHLLEQGEVDDYFLDVPRTKENSSRGRLYWQHVPLPILPKKFLYVPSKEDSDRSAQLKEIGRLMKSATDIFNAADRDREGQLIFDEIIEHFGISGKPIKRLIFSSLDDAALERAFNSAVDNKTPGIFNMGLAAKTRGQADWLIGMNGTRAMTLAHVTPAKGAGSLNVGRVMTPTMSVVVRRHLEILNFKSSAFYVPMVELPDGTVLEWKKRLDESDTKGLDANGKIIDRALAERIVKAINDGLEGEITEAKSTERREEPPLPFSLPSIQSELSKKYGLTVEEITEACQSLYQKKMQTYVGTDCPYLPEAMHGEASDVLNGLKAMFGKAVSGTNVTRKYGCWNDKKLSGEGGAAHHGIIPTGIKGSISSEAERLVYQAVCNRYIAQFYPEHRYLAISLKAAFGGATGDEFNATAKAVISNGWKDVEGEGDTNEDRTTDNDRTAPDSKAGAQKPSNMGGRKG